MVFHCAELGIHGEKAGNGSRPCKLELPRDHFSRSNDAQPRAGGQGQQQRGNLQSLRKHSYLLTRLSSRSESLRGERQPVNHKHREKCPRAEQGFLLVFTLILSLCKILGRVHRVTESTGFVERHFKVSMTRV